MKMMVYYSKCRELDVKITLIYNCYTSLKKLCAWPNDCSQGSGFLTLGGVIVLADTVTVCERLNTPHGELELRQRSMESDVHWEITQDGYFICSTTRNLSTAELVHFGLETLSPTGDGLKVLIAGLGLGFSLRAALMHQHVSRADVVEWEKAIIGWHLRFLGPSSKDALMDPRTQLIAGNLLDVLPRIQTRYHLMALDIDNGPDWLVHPENAGVYRGEFLSVICDHLEPGGVLTIWSDQYQESFLHLLRSFFQSADVKQVWDKDGDGKPLKAFIYRAIM